MAVGRREELSGVNFSHTHTHSVGRPYTRAKCRDGQTRITTEERRRSLQGSARCNGPIRCIRRRRRRIIIIIIIVLYYGVRRAPIMRVVGKKKVKKGGRKKETRTGIINIDVASVRVAYNIIDSVWRSPQPSRTCTHTHTRGERTYARTHKRRASRTHTNAHTTRTLARSGHDVWWGTRRRR